MAACVAASVLALCSAAVQLPPLAALEGSLPRPIGRRPLGAAAAAAAAAGAAPALAALAAWRGEVGPGAPFASLAAALAAAPTEATVTVVLRPGTYKERIQVAAGAKLTLEAAPPGAAAVVWETSRPYESALYAAPGAEVVVRGIKFRHASKSVANNYGVFSQGANLTLEECEVTSSTGAGVAAEGGVLTLRGGKVQDCSRQGLVLLGPLRGVPLRAAVSGTLLRNNGRSLGEGDAVRGPFDGVLARAGVEAELTDVVVQGSGQAGVAVGEDTRVVIIGGALKENAGGATREDYDGEIVFKP